jgi:hypothetical protein
MLIYVMIVLKYKRNQNNMPVSDKNFYNHIKNKSMFL